MARTLGVLSAFLFCACVSHNGLAPGAVRTPLACSALPGTAEILDSRDERFLVFGELHGTREAPREFAEIVCEAAMRGEVVVAIERPPNLTSSMQAFVESDGDLKAEAALMAAFFDGSQWGLSSEVFLALFKRLRALRSAGATIRTVGFREGPPPGPDGDQTPYERGLAQQLLNAAEAHARARVLVLVGNLHARPTPVPASSSFTGFEPMAMHLPSADLLSFDLRYEAGEVFNCTADGCGPRRVNGRGPGPRRLELIADRGFHGVWAVGPISAATPIGGRQ
jgi:hypothetical protein